MLTVDFLDSVLVWWPDQTSGGVSLAYPSSPPLPPGHEASSGSFWANTSSKLLLDIGVKDLPDTDQQNWRWGVYTKLLRARADVPC